MDNLSFHKLLSNVEMQGSLRKPSLWIVDDISDIDERFPISKDYRLVRLVHAKNEEPSLALCYFANNDIVFPEYQYESMDNNDTRIGYGKAYYFDRKKTKELSGKYNHLHGYQQNLLESFHLEDALKRNSELEQALQEDFRNIQKSIEGNRVSQKEGDVSGLCFEDKDFIRIHTFNVGQGETIVIQFPNNRVWIIDAFFRWNKMFESFSSWLTSEIPEFVCDKLILSHLHSDHIKDAIKLMDFVNPIDVVYHDIRTSPTSIAVNVLNHAVKKYNLVSLKGTEHLKHGKARIELIPANELSALNASNDVNTKGIIVTIETPKSQVILPGDVHGDQLQELMQQKFVINPEKIKYYKVTHHCSLTGNNQSFLKALNPTYAVTSCGKDNKHKHPSLHPKEQIDDMTKRNNGTHSVTAESKKEYFSWDVY